MTQQNTQSIEKNPTRTLIKMLRRRRAFIFGITLLGFSLSAFYITFAKPVYTAQASILIEGRNQAFLTTQPHILMSQKFIKKALNGLSPDKNRQNFKSIKLTQSSAQHFTDKDINEISSSLHASLTKDSSLLHIKYQSQDEQHAKYIVSTLAQYYILTAPPEQINAPKASPDVLGVLKQNAILSAQELIDFQEQLKTQQPIPEPPSATREALQANHIAAKKRLEILQAGGKSNALSYTPHLLDGLALQLSNSDKELQSLRQKYGDKHHKIIALQKKKSRIQAHINDLKKRSIERAKVEYKYAKSLLNALSDTQGQTHEIIVKMQDEMIKMLQKNKNQSEKLHQEFKAAYAGLQQKPRISLLTPLNDIIQRTAPNKIVILSAGTAASLTLSLLLALLLETRRSTYLSGKDIEYDLRVPCNGLIPLIKKEAKVKLGDYAIKHPASVLCEAVRALRLMIKIRTDMNATTDKKEGTVLLITSSLPNEGKTALSVWLGYLAAKAGEKVILVDADLRRPCIHDILQQPNTKSVAEHLSKQETLDAVIDKSDPSGMHAIYGRSVPNSALDLCASNEMAKMIQRLRSKYDLVIIDSPACMAVSDAFALAQHSDHVLYAAAWNKTNKEIIHNGVSQFRKLFGDELNRKFSTVLTRIDLKKYVALGFGDTIEYYGDY